MRIAEAARRSTLRSDTSEFYLRIFDSWSCGMRTEELAGAGVDGPPWQTYRAFLPPAAGCPHHASNAPKMEWREDGRE